MCSAGGGQGRQAPEPWGLVGHRKFSFYSKCNKNILEGFKHRHNLVCNTVANNVVLGRKTS